MRNTKKGRNKYTKKSRNKYTKKSRNKTKYNRCKKKFRSKKSRKLTVNKPKHGGMLSDIHAKEKQATPQFPWWWCYKNDETICNESLEKYIKSTPSAANCTKEQLRDKYILSCKDYIINTLASLESYLGPKPWFADNGFGDYKAKILAEYEKLSQKQKNLYLQEHSVTASNNSPAPPLVDAEGVEVVHRQEEEVAPKEEVVDSEKVEVSLQPANRLTAVRDRLTAAVPRLLSLGRARGAGKVDDALLPRAQSASDPGGLPEATYT